MRRLRQNVRRCSETFGGLLLRRGSKFGMNIITTQIIGRFEKACAHGFGWKNDREYCYGFRHLLGIAIRKGRHNIVSAFYQSLDQLVFFFVVPSATSFLSTATEKKQKKAATAWGLIWGVASSCVWRTGVRVRTRHRKGKHPPLRNGIWGGAIQRGKVVVRALFSRGARFEIGKVSIDGLTKSYCPVKTRLLQQENA